MGTALFTTGKVGAIMRLIDADAYAFPGDLINEPTVDAVKVVRCRDCKHYYDYGVNRDYCCHRSKCGKQVFDVKFKADDFCSYGKRKDGND